MRKRIAVVIAALAACAAIAVAAAAPAAAANTWPQDLAGHLKVTTVAVQTLAEVTACC